MSKDTFITYDENGNEKVCDILFTFDWEETGKFYIVYTDNEKDEAGNTQVYASILNKGDTKLEAITTEREWELIESILDTLQTKIRKGETVDTGEIKAEINKLFYQE